MSEDFRESVPIRTFNLPSFPTRFVGRHDELAEIGQLLADPHCHLLTLVGPGGIGKTRLALEAARQFDGGDSRFADGIFFIPLQSTSSPEFIVPTIAEAIHFQFHQGRDPGQQLFDFLREKSALLVLDNLEHLLNSAELLANILSAAPNVRILATSRERLNLLEEWVFEVPGLPFPVSKTEPDIEHYSAVGLFILNARRVHAGFNLDAASTPDVIRICRLVGGMPLGIELAAAWTRVLPCKAIADEIEGSLDILNTSIRNIEPRHRTMRAAFEPTWKRLSVAEGEVFKRLSVFHGSFTRAAAEYVAGAALGTLSALIDKSLLRVSATERYDIHELLRQYAAEQLSPHERDQAHERHCAYYAEFLHQRWEHLKGKYQKQALEEIDAEIDNVRAGWYWAVMHQRHEAIEKAMDSLWFFYDTRGLYQEGEQAFRIAAADEMYEGQGLVLGRLLARQGGFCFSLNQPERARNLLEESLTLLRQHHAHSEVGFTLLRLSEVIMFNESDPVAAKGYLQECLSLFQKANDSWGTAYTVRWLGFAALQLEEFEEARRLSLESLAMYQETQDQAGIAIALSIVGLASLGLGAYHEARQAGQESLTLCREIGLQWAAIQGLLSMAGAACALGDYRESHQYYYEALRDIHELQIIADTLWVLVETVNLWIALGRPEWALEILALATHSRIPPAVGKPAALRHLAKLEAELPADLVKTAIERARMRDFDTIVRDVLAELQTSQAAAPAAHSIPGQTLASSLTERELEILGLLAEGLSNPQIAERLVVATGTVKAHTNSIFSKLDVSNRVQAVNRARELGLL